MARKHPPRQVSFDSLLEPDVALNPRVILISDTRWAQALRDLAAVGPRGVGLDIEYFSDAVSVGGGLEGEEDDPFTTTIRLIQVAFTSATLGHVCVIADFGAVGEDRAARLGLYGDTGAITSHTIDGVTVAVPDFTPGSFLDVLRNLVESPTIPKILHNAKGDALRLRIAFGMRMRCIRCTMLLSQEYWAGLKNTRHGLLHVSDRAAAQQAPGVWRVEKRLQRSEWRWRLSNAQVNYAADDALIMHPLFKWLGGLCNEAGLTPSCLAECGAIPAFVEFEFNGMTVNPAMLDDQIEMWERGRALALRPFQARYPGIEASKRNVVAVAMSLDDCYGGHVFYELDETRPRRRPVFILGQRIDYAFLTKLDKYATENDHSVAEIVLAKWNKLPWVSALLDWRSMGVVVQWMKNIRKRLRKDSRVRGEYAQIAGGENRSGDDAEGRGHGRSACRQPSLQQSANPQPKLNNLIHKAMQFTGEAASLSPRLPFVGHDEVAAGYLRWALARLRGELPDPFNSLQDASRGALSAAATTWQGETAAQPGSVIEGDLDDAGDEEVEQMDGDDAPFDLDARIAWYEELVQRWEMHPRDFIVADFSQAHMRIAAEASRDPQLLEDFLQDRDAHLKLAYDFGVATGQVPADLPIEAFFAWYDKKHPKHKFVKSLRQPAKTGNYTSLNLGSVARLKGAGDTAKPPILLSYEQWEIIRDAWRKRYVGLFAYQKAHIRTCNAIDVVVDGTHYGAAWSLATGRRLWLAKEADKYDRDEAKWCAGCGRTHGRLVVKGTDAVAFRWLSTEADAIKWAMARVLEDFDRHDIYWMSRGKVPIGDVWDAKMMSMAHDELDADCRKQYALAVAACVRRHFAAGLRWAGLRDVPPEPGDARDADLIVRSWADK